MRFCEECGAQLEDNARFCEECGAEQEPLIIEQKPEVVTEENVIELAPENNNELHRPSAVMEQVSQISQESHIQENIVVTGKTNEKQSDIKARKKGKWKLAIAVIFVLLLAGMAGFLFGKHNSAGQNLPQTDEISDDKISDEPTPTSKPTSTPTPKPTATPTPSPTATPAPKPTATPTPSPTATPTPKPTATPTPTPILSVFEGFMLGERESSVWQMKTPDGIHLTLNDDPMARIGVIWDEGHSFEFSFDEIMVGSTDAGKIYTFYGAEGYMNPVNGHYDELQLSFTHDTVSVYWAYHFGQTVAVYYDNVVSMEFANCTSDYVSYGKQTMEVSDVTVEIQKSDNLFQNVESGEIVYVDLYADMEDEISMRLSYNDEIEVSFIDLYGYSESVSMNGVVTNEIRYDTDACYYIVPRFAEGPDFWGEPLQALSEYHTYYEVKLNVSEEGIQLRWTLCEDAVEKVLYDGMIDVEFVERRVKIRHY